MSNDSCCGLVRQVLCERRGIHKCRDFFRGLSNHTFFKIIVLTPPGYLHYYEPVLVSVKKSGCTL